MLTPFCRQTRPFWTSRATASKVVCSVKLRGARMGGVKRVFLSAPSARIGKVKGVSLSAPSAPSFSVSKGTNVADRSLFKRLFSSAASRTYLRARHRNKIQNLRKNKTSSNNVRTSGQRISTFVCVAICHHRGRITCPRLLIVSVKDLSFYV